ncbi:MAG: hypothetical protein ACRBCJ_02000 [Hyphomicrobiaceae bacterium]
MIETNIDVVMERLCPYLDIYDQILRHGHDTFKRYPTDLAVELDASTQAHITFRHILAEAHRKFDGATDVRHFEINRQNLWQFSGANAIVRFKKTDEDGISSNYPTRQAMAFDQGDELPDLPAAPTRLTIGYLLDATGMEYVRSQVSLPDKSGTIWCAAIIPANEREADQQPWREVSRNLRLAV